MCKFHSFCKFRSVQQFALNLETNSNQFYRLIVFIHLFWPLFCGTCSGNVDCYQRLVQRLQDTRWKACQQIRPRQQAHKQGKFHYSFFSYCNAEDISVIWWYSSLPQLGICPEDHWRNQRIMGETGEEEDSCRRALASLTLRSHEKPTHSFSMLFWCDICIASSSEETFCGRMCNSE